jgi:hypothetical protein
MYLTGWWGIAEVDWGKGGSSSSKSWEEGRDPLHFDVGELERELESADMKM